MASARLNVDFLRWFNEDEREQCESCGERTAVSFSEVDATFCLGCAAVWLHGRRLDEKLRIPIGRFDSASSG